MTQSPRMVQPFSTLRELHNAGGVRGQAKHEPDANPKPDFFIPGRN